MNMYILLTTIAKNIQMALDIQGTNTDLIEIIICVLVEGVHQSWEFVCTNNGVHNYLKIFYVWVAPIMGVCVHQ